MAGAIDKKKNDVLDGLKSSPTTHVSARASILADIALSREFADTFLKALCEPLTGGKNTSGAAATMSLGKVCEELAAQRLICRGHSSIKGLADGIRKFSLPPISGSGTLSGSLGLTEPSTSLFGIKATDIGETYPITLSTSSTATQTEGSNTFSVYVGDYYLVRSRVSGELIDIADEVDPYSKPDTETVFGNAIAWVSGTGGDVSSEEEANTWNYNWATANIASVTLNNSGAFNELTTLTLESALTPGSNSANYTPLGPAFAQKFYLKRKADFVDTFTITGTTSVNSVSITGVSEADLAKVKYGDVISGTGIPDDNVTIQAVQTEKNAIRLTESGTATAVGTVTLTVNSVPFGYAKDDIFCQVEVVAEGLVTNDDWKPIGNTTGGYSGTNEGADDLLVANTTQFIGMLGFFDPNNTTNPDNSSNDITKGASSKDPSDGKEVSGTTYPYVTRNPFFPSHQGTSKAHEEKDGEITGTQPGTNSSPKLGNKDLWSGRFVRFDFERANAAGALPEFRYIINNAEKFYYRPNAQMAVAKMGSDSTNKIDAEAMPRGLTTDKEPRAELPTSPGLSEVITILRANTTLAGSSNASPTAVPQDDAISTPSANSSSGSVPSTDYSYTYRLAGGTNGIIRKGGWKTEYYGPTHNSMSGTAGTLTQGYTSFGRVALTGSEIIDYNIVTNYVSRKLTTDGTAVNADVGFVAGVVNDLQGTGSGSARFRDPVMEAASQKHMTSASANDASFDTYIASTAGTNPWEAAKSAVEGELTTFYTTAKLMGTGVRDDGTAAAGFAAVTGQVRGPTSTSGSAVKTKWETFSDASNTLLTNLNSRIAEIDARIGKPTYNSQTGASAGSPPSIYVSDIPSSNSANPPGLVPYGRSIYNACNYLLGQDIDLLGGIIKDIESLTDLIDIVKSDRNKYEIFDGRDKVYT